MKYTREIILMFYTWLNEAEKQWQIAATNDELGGEGGRVTNISRSSNNYAWLQFISLGRGRLPLKKIIKGTNIQFSGGGGWSIF